MSKAKAFWISLLASLAVLAPVYSIAAAVIFLRPSPAGTAQSGIPVRPPLIPEARTVLIMTGASQPENFALLRFDPENRRICCTALPAETVVLADGHPLTLAQAAENAGPAQAAACIRETLEIPVDHYLYCTQERLAKLCASFAPARIPLEQYVNRRAAGILRMKIPGARTLTLTPQDFAGVLRAKPADVRQLALLRAEGMLAFLRVNADALADRLPDALRRELGSLSCNLTAGDLIDLESAFRYLRNEEVLEYRSDLLPGSWTDGRYELAEGAREGAAALFAPMPKTA